MISQPPKNSKLMQSVMRLRDRPPKTREELSYYLRHFYGVFLPDTIVEQGNSTPLDFVWDVYSTAMDFNPNPYYNFLAMSTRGGNKSLSAAVIEMLVLHHDPIRNWFHMASIKEQSYVTYSYFESIARRQIMAGVVSEPTRRETISKNGTRLRIGTASMDSVNSFHGSLVQDELDLTPRAIFNESKGMLSAEQGRMPINVCISSRKFSYGNVQKLIDDVKNDASFPLKIHKWGILEITSKCLPERHGDYGAELWVNEEDLIAITPEQHQAIPNDTPNKSKYNKMIGYKNCAQCGIFSFCQGRLPKQANDNPYLQPIDVTKTYFKTEDSEFFKSQRLNRRPSSKGLIYSMWDEDIHVKTYAQMWEIFHGVKHPDMVIGSDGARKRWDITIGELMDAFIKAGARCVIGVDFGFSVLAVAGLYFIDGSGRIYFIDEIGVTGLSDAELATEIKQRWGTLPVDMVYADPESPSGKKEIRKITGWAVTDKVDKHVENGISTVRRFMRVPGTRQAAFFVAPQCHVFREEVPLYHNKVDPKTNEPTDEVAKGNDHSCDQVRYVIHTIFGGVQVDLGFSGAAPTLPQHHFNIQAPTRAPTATEYAEKLGAQFSDNRAEFDLEKGKRKDDPNSGGAVGGGGGFTFSF